MTFSLVHEPTGRVRDRFQKIALMRIARGDDLNFEDQILTRERMVAVDDYGFPVKSDDPEKPLF